MNAEKHRQEQRLYRVRHPERVQASQKRFREMHPGRIEALNRQWREAHPDRANENRQKWFAAHPGYRESLSRSQMEKQRKKEWWSTQAGRDCKARINHRRRGLPTMILKLNQPFTGSHLHHVEENIGVYIPLSLHQSIAHNLRTGKGMIAINEAVSNWLYSGASKK